MRPSEKEHIHNNYNIYIYIYIRAASQIKITYAITNSEDPMHPEIHEI